MKIKKKREFEISELTQILSKKWGWEDGYTSVQIQYFFQEHWQPKLVEQIENLYYSKGFLRLKIKSPLFKTDLKMQNQALISQINHYLEAQKVLLLEIY